MSLRKPVAELGVELALLGDDPEPHIVYLPPGDSSVDAVESYLQSPRRFLPMMWTGLPRIINKDQILWLRLDRSGVDSNADVTAVRYATILELSDRSRLEGYVCKQAQARLSDVLNDRGEFFLRLDDAQSVYFVNKAHVRFAVPQ